MSQAADLLASLEEYVPVHTHDVADPDNYFVIDPDTRQIFNLSNSVNVLMQNDHNSEVYTFEIPRFVEGHDMLKCDRVRLHYINVERGSSNKYKDVYEMSDLKVNPANSATLISTWTVKRQATQYAGNLSFVIQYLCIDKTGEEGANISYEWHTDIYKDIEVRETINNSEQAIIEYTDILEEWYQLLFGMEDSLVTAVVAAADAQKTSIELKGEEVLATIPEDYTATYNMAEEALRKKANAIEQTTEGETILIDDSADAHLLGMNLYGKTSQVTTTGAQLFDGRKLTDITNNGVAMVNDGLGRITLNGTASSAFSSVNIAITDLPTGTYSVSGDIAGKIFYFVRVTLSDGTLKYYRAPNTFVLDGTEKEILGYLYAHQGGVRFDHEIICPMLNSGTTALSWEPYTGGYVSPSPEWIQDLSSIENATINVYGKNLIRPKDLYTNPGYVDLYSSALLALKYKVDKGRTYTLSFDTENTGKLMYINPNSGFDYAQFRMDGTRKSFTKTMNHNIDSNVQVALVSVCETTDVACGEISNVQLTLVVGDSEYETFEEPQSLDVSRALPGIPVSQNGNYTDDNGQQWICDEIDFERGVYIKRIGDVTLNGSKTYKINNYQLNSRGSYMFEYYPGDITNVEQDVPVMSDKLIRDKWGNFNNSETRSTVYCLSGRIAVHLADQTIQTVEAFQAYVGSNPIRVLYALATPIETPLTDEEITLYKRLKTNYHNTTVLNDAGAHMAVKYNADTKMFFENHSIATNAQVEAAVNAYLTNYFANAEGVSF